MQKTLTAYGIKNFSELLLGETRIGYRRSDAAAAEQRKLALERHFNDLYTVFLHKLTGLVLQPSVSEKEITRLRTFFDELLKARENLDK